MAELQQRRHAETKGDIVAAALALFEQHGFGQVTMEDIAQAAGVSRRTVYRRFRTKDRIVLEVPKRWLAVWDAAVAALPAASPIAVAEASCLAVARYIDAHRSEVLTAYAALGESSTLTSTGATSGGWIDRVVGLLRREPAMPSESMAYVIAGAYLGAIDAMMTQWVKGDGRGSALRETEALLDRLRPIWPDD
ncbi:MAG: TetR/AcrR family transcriptional regulator [Actinobacteria bacterium]|nr:TetR/AcrR family transcriptional regulator [Actinomycetota bacterium]